MGRIVAKVCGIVLVCAIGTERRLHHGSLTNYPVAPLPLWLLPIQTEMIPRTAKVRPRQTPKWGSPKSSLHQHPSLHQPRSLPRSPGPLLGTNRSQRAHKDLAAGTTLGLIPGMTLVKTLGTILGTMTRTATTRRTTMRRWVERHPGSDIQGYRRGRPITFIRARGGISTHTRLKHPCGSPSHLPLGLSDFWSMGRRSALRLLLSRLRASGLNTCVA